MILVINGHPGCGKTTLATALTSEIQKKSNCLLIHTDIIKVVLRQLGVQGLSGLSCLSTAAQKSKIMAPFLHKQISKAQKDGYHLIIEGTLALGLNVSDIGYNIEIHVPPEVRTCRQSQKPLSTQKSLSQNYSFEIYEHLIRKYRPSDTIIIDGTKDLDLLIHELSRLFDTTINNS
ncbi:MAG: hypothetical protein CL916_03065 [Deltaproteobacteria bacterium]|nr:hypothetical protein [Deltaproteobacteria bacterium]